jgi:hypothetical protein
VSLLFREAIKLEMILRDKTPTQNILDAVTRTLSCKSDDPLKILDSTLKGKYLLFKFTLNNFQFAAKFQTSQYSFENVNKIL